MEKFTTIYNIYTFFSHKHLLYLWLSSLFETKWLNLINGFSVLIISWIQTLLLSCIIIDLINLNATRSKSFITCIRISKCSTIYGFIRCFICLRWDDVIWSLNNWWGYLLFLLWVATSFVRIFIEIGNLRFTIVKVDIVNDFIFFQTIFLTVCSNNPSIPLTLSSKFPISGWYPS